MLKINRDKLNADKRQTPINSELEKFATQVSLAKPLCDFVAEKNSIKNVVIEGEAHEFIMRLYLYQNGDSVGEVFVDHQYKRGSNELEPVYGVKSFRIEKSRGDRDSKRSKDIKVALRIAKKMLVARELEEMRSVIDEKISSQLQSLFRYKYNDLLREMDCNRELSMYAINAYQARKRGENTLTITATPVTIPPNKLDKHNKMCEEYMEVHALNEYYKTKQGYGVKVMADASIVVLSYADNTLCRFKSYDELPSKIAEKFAMFKVLQKDEPYVHLGCKFDSELLYISP